MPEAIWLFFGGYVIVKVKGPNIEPFINAAVARGVPLWRVERMATDVAVLRAGVAHFRELGRAGRRTGVRVRILARGGLPFLWHATRRRSAFALGAAAALTLLYGLSSFIWFVQVEGVQAIDREMVLQAAQSAGLRPGVARRAVDPERVQRRLLLDLDRLAWAAVRLRGSRAVIEVAEKTVVSEAEGYPGHVVAARDGVIAQIVPFRGEPLVGPGDTVGRGQVLISGELSSGAPQYQELVGAGKEPLVHADGVVKARVWYEGVAKSPLVGAETEPTGRVSRGVYGRFGQRRVAFGAARTSPFTQSRREVWALPGGRLTPLFEVGWVIEREVRLRTTPKSPDDARQAALGAAWQQISAYLPPTLDLPEAPQIDIKKVSESGAEFIEARIVVENIEDIKAFKPLVTSGGDREG